MASPGSFGKRMKAYANKLPERVNEIKKEAARETLIELVNATPVASGKAKSSYVVGITSPSRAEPSGPFDRGGSLSLAQARKIGTVQPGTAIYISNNIAYILALNNGRSRKAPSGFIQRAVARGQETIRNRLKRGLR